MSGLCASPVSTRPPTWTQWDFHRGPSGSGRASTAAQRVKEPRPLISDSISATSIISDTSITPSLQAAYKNATLSKYRDDPICLSSFDQGEVALLSQRLFKAEVRVQMAKDKLSGRTAIPAQPCIDLARRDRLERTIARNSEKISTLLYMLFSRSVDYLGKLSLYKKATLKSYRKEPVHGGSFDPDEAALLSQHLSEAEQRVQEARAELIGSKTTPAQPCLDQARHSELEETIAHYSEIRSTFFKMFTDRGASYRSVDYYMFQQAKRSRANANGNPANRGPLRSLRANTRAVQDKPFNSCVKPKRPKDLFLYGQE